MDKPGRAGIFRSLRFRMALSHGAILALILIVLGGVGYPVLARNLMDSATSVVQNAAQVEADQIMEAGKVTPPPEDDVPSASATRIGVFLPDGSIIGEREQVPSWLRPQSHTPATIRALGERVRVVTLPVASLGTTVATVVAGRSLAPEDHLLDRVRLFLALGFVIGVAGSMGAGWILAGRAARPVRRAYEAQASFAADASHELRTPLAFVRSGVEVLAEHDPVLGEDVIREVGYLTDLTERLLLIARADSGTLSLPTEPTALGTLFLRAGRRNETIHQAELEVRVDENLVALADPVALEAALDALLENVARHGGGAAQLSAESAEGKALLTVADRGPGLTPGERARAFDRFFRVDPARSREDGAAGLGLALAKALVEAQGGRIWLEETPGGGLTVRIQIPEVPRPSPPGLRTAYRG